MNTRTFIKTLAVAAPALFLPKLIKPSWKVIHGGSPFEEWPTTLNMMVSGDRGIVHVRYRFWDKVWERTEEPKLIDGKRFYSAFCHSSHPDFKHPSFDDALKVAYQLERTFHRIAPVLIPRGIQKQIE